MNIRRRLDEPVPPAPWHLAALAVAALAFPGTALSDETPRTSWGAPRPAGHMGFPLQSLRSSAQRSSATRSSSPQRRSPHGRRGPLKAREDRRNRDPVLGQGDVDVGYNAFWLDRGEKMTGTLRTSLRRGSSPTAGCRALKETARTALRRAVRPLGRSACRDRRTETPP